MRRFESCRGRSHRHLVGLAPTENPVELGGVSIFEIHDGSIVRHTAFNDVIPLLHQCGADLPPEWVAFAHHPGRSDHLKQEAV